MSEMKIAILGATRGMGRAVARALAERGDELFLLGRNADDLERSARDLEVRGRMARGASDFGDGAARDGGRRPSRPARGERDRGREGRSGPGASDFGTAHCDLADPATFGPALDAAEEALGGLDGVIVTAGVFATQEELEADRSRLTELLELDFTHTVLFCEEARERLIRRSNDGGRGVLCVFSSVAGDRARKPVVFYGAAKAGLSYYLEGIDLRFRGEGLRVVAIKPGFVRTSMTEGLPEPPFAGEPEDVAKRVVRAIDRADKSARPTYAPGPWRWIMLIVRNLPRWVRRRVGF